MTNKKPVVLETVSEERLAEILAGLEGVTPGPWEPARDYAFQTDPLSILQPAATGANGGHKIANFYGPDREANAKTFARLDPDTVRSIVSELLASRLAIQAPATLDEWGEEDGDVVWWCWRNGEWLGESPYIGSPLDLGQTVEIELRTNQGEFVHRHDVGGWPGYHTHWTPRPALPAAPNLGATK